jgi:hypothetical protein
MSSKDQEKKYSGKLLSFVENIFKKYFPYVYSGKYKEGEERKEGTKRGTS